MEHVAGDRVGGVEDGEEQDMVGLLPLVGPLVQLDVHQLGRQQDGVGGRPHCCCLLLVVRVVVDPRPLRHRRHEVVRVIHVQGHLSACLDMCCGLLVICVPGGMQCGCPACGSNVPGRAQLSWDCVVRLEMPILISLTP